MAQADNEKRVIESERAMIDRWFAHSPLGPLFVADDGSMRPIAADALGPWRDEAFSILDKFIVDSRPPPQWALVVIIVGFTWLLLALTPLLGLKGGEIGGIIMAGLLLWHGHDFYLLWRYRRDLRALRSRIAASLALRTPVPAELARRYRRSNVWRTMLHLWIWSIVALALLSTHFADVEKIRPEVFPVLVGSVGIAWLLYFLARRTDLAQSREASLASRPTPPISPP